MTPQELKNSILQLAIQGKLVEQRPEEGTAAELYKQIQAEKQALIKAGKIKKEKPLPEITEDEVPFEIPENWMWVRLGNISLIEAGGTPDRNNPEYWNGDVPWVKIGDISSRDVTSTSEYLTQKGLDNSSAKVFPAGTLLYTIFATIGTVGILRINAATNQAIAGITLFADTDINYLYHVCVGLKYILIAQAHGMAQMNINQKILRNTPIPLPPLAEQERIVAKIEELLPLIERYEKAWSRLEDFNKRFPVDMQKSILQMAIQGKLVEQRPEEGTGEELYRQIQAEKQALIKAGKIKKEKPLPEIAESEAEIDIPNHWALYKLGIISSIITDGEHKTPRRVVDYCGYYLLSARNIRDGYISLQDVDYVDKDEYKILSKRCNPKYGDVLISCSGSVGRCTVVNDDNNYVMVRSAAMVSPLVLNSTYLMYAIRSEYVQGQIRDKTKQTAQANLFQDAIRNLIIPLPPLAEQERIVARLKELLPLCERLK